MYGFIYSSDKTMKFAGGVQKHRRGKRLTQNYKAGKGLTESEIVLITSLSNQGHI